MIEQAEVEWNLSRVIMFSGFGPNGTLFDLPFLFALSYSADMTAQELVNELKGSEEFFERSGRCLTEDNSGFSPAQGTWTASQQVAHVARTIDWFVEGASRPEGFDMEFEKHVEEVMAVTSLKSAREWLAKSYEAARKFFEGKSEAEVNRPLPPGPIMGGQPIRVVVGAICEHTAHHRGALTVYSRLLGKTPLMPYMES